MSTVDGPTGRRTRSRAAPRGSFWDGTFAFGQTCAAYRGATADNTRHTHAAIQIVLSRDAPVWVETDAHRVSGTALVIRPMVEHALVAFGPVSLVWVERRSAVAEALLAVVETADVAPIPAELLPDRLCEEHPDAWLCRIAGGLDPPARMLDLRLAAALDHLAAAPGARTVADAVVRSGLSESRLRALAREQLGVSIATWLIWRKLERAARELTSGASLAEAAMAGGFSDQAHFTRAMRRMFGVTPRVALRTLC